METAKCNSTYRRYNDYLYDLEVLENIRLYDDYEAYKQDRLIALQAQKPMPTLESKREKLSRLVSQDYRISYNKELELRTNESLLALDKPKEVEDEIDGVFVSDKVCSTYFTYGHTFSDVQSIIEKYDLESGEEVFKRGLGETEALTGSVEKKRGMQLTDAQIESMGTTAPVDTDMEQPSLVEEDEEQPQLGIFNSDLVTDINAEVNPIIGSEPELEYVVKGSSDLVEDNEVDVTGIEAETESDTEDETESDTEAETDTEAEPEQEVDASELEAMRYLQSGYSEPSPESSTPIEPSPAPSEIDSNGIELLSDADVGKYLDDDDDEDYVDDEDEDDTEGTDEADIEQGVEQEPEPVQIEQEQVEQVPDDAHPVETISDTNEDDEEYLDDDEEYLDDEDSEDDEEYLDDEDDEELDSDDDNVSDESTDDAEVPVNTSPPVEQPSQAKGYSHPQEQSQEPFNLDTSDVNIDFNGNNDRASPVQQPVQPVQNRAGLVQKADSQGITDEEKHDLRLFLRHHPRCEYSLVSQYFSKKEIQDNITRGKIIKRGKTLRLI